MGRYMFIYRQGPWLEYKGKQTQILSNGEPWLNMDQNGFWGGDHWYERWWLVWWDADVRISTLECGVLDVTKPKDSSIANIQI